MYVENLRVASVIVVVDDVQIFGFVYHLSQSENVFTILQIGIRLQYRIANQPQREISGIATSTHTYVQGVELHTFN